MHLQWITWKKPELYQYEYDFSVDYNTDDVKNNADIHEILLEKRDVK